MGPPGQTLVDWAWNLQVKQATGSRLGMGSRLGKLLLMKVGKYKRRECMPCACATPGQRTACAATQGINYAFDLT